MEKKDVTKIIAGVVIAGSIIGGAFTINRLGQEVEVKQMRINLVEKSEQNALTYSEYLQLINEYNAEIQKEKAKGNVFKLENINKDNSIIKRMNERIVK